MNGKNKGFTRVFTLHFALTRHLQHSSSTFGVDLQAASQTPPFLLCLPSSFSPARSTSWQENRYGLAAASRDSSWSCYLDKTGRRHHRVTSSGSGDSACCVRQELSRFFTPEILPGCSREKGYIAFREKACAESLCEQRERDREESRTKQVLLPNCEALPGYPDQHYVTGWDVPAHGAPVIHQRDAAVARMVPWG